MPSPLPTLSPIYPTKKPTSSPGQPTIMPTIVPSPIPTPLSLDPTKKPTSSPLSTQGGQPTIMPTIVPSPIPTLSPMDPTKKPTSSPPPTQGGQPTITPTIVPSSIPTRLSVDPTKNPTSSPLPTQGGQPTVMPSPLPTLSPIYPTKKPTSSPGQPTIMPTIVPSPIPTPLSLDPTKKPTSSPLSTQGGQPTIMPTIVPSPIPTLSPMDPTKKPTSSPPPTQGGQPTITPTIVPSPIPTRLSMHPTKNPTSSPLPTQGGLPTIMPTIMPSPLPTLSPINPTKKPTSSPPPTKGRQPTIMPTIMPSPLPTLSPIDGMQCSTDNDCYQFQDLDSWNQEYVTSLCSNSGNTDKSMSATLCNAYVDNIEYENSLKLAILNTMYGTSLISTDCPQWCMYDPLNVVGDTAVVFKWNNQQGCWIVHVGRTHPLCHEKSVSEWGWAHSKTQNWCCPSDPTPEPTKSPLPLPGSPTRSPTKDLLCSADEDCYQFRNLDSWNQEYVTSLCVNHGNTDKSITATLCDAYAGNVDYENSLKLAILNTMYGTTPSTTMCPWYCMYDPLNIVGDTAVGFKWKNSHACWNVLIGGTNPLCYVQSRIEWEQAVAKTQKWCCASVHTVKPTSSPQPTPGGQPTIMPTPLPTLSPINGMLCSSQDDCYQFQGLDSWNQGYVSSLCMDDGRTDKSTNATVCEAYGGNIDYVRSLMLAILNTMYGTGPSTSQCGYFCMYDPQNLVGTAAVGFKWNNIQSCWNVLLGASNKLCYISSVNEWHWAIHKSRNFCCPS